ncbi:uncharacterized protein LOC128210711 [Mya arenaria]|uniref:uncharacterized protein LOC128210711 n=1 Tax=Mya arenaria TaxID=6604 RepID=UPI0022E4DC2B|nr:uncharacterized protein LOC128210711 [Mya arenaria]
MAHVRGIHECMFNNHEYCQSALWTERQETSPCAAALDRKLFSISNQCSVVLESPGTLANLTGNKCTMFEVFYQCSYNYIPSSLRYTECESQHTELRKVAYNNVANVASNVNNVPLLSDFTDCVDRPVMTPGDVCNSPDKLLAIVDTRCYRKFRLLTDSNVCQILSEFVYECSPLVLGQLGITCADDSVMHALTTLSDVIKQAYYLDVGKLQAENEGKSLLTERQETSPCAAALDRKLFSISNQCSVVLESPGTLANLTGNKCTMFEVFYQCSYNYIPSSLRYTECERQHTELRKVAYNNVANVASNVNNVPLLSDFTDCVDRPVVTPGDVCNSPDKLLAIVDTRCYRKFRLLTDSNVCQILSEFVYECSPLVLGQLGITCADDSVMHALTTLSDVIKQAYYLDVGKLQAENEGKCIDKSQLQQAGTL